MTRRSGMMRSMTGGMRMIMIASTVIIGISTGAIGMSIATGMRTHGATIEMTSVMRSGDKCE